MKIDIIVTKSGLTTKEYLKDIRFSQKLYKAVKNDGGEFLRNGLIYPNWEKLEAGDILSLVLPKENIGENITAIPMELNIIYEDQYLLILNKPSGIAVIPTTKHFNQSLANGIAHYYKTNSIASNIHYINRLDAETTGLIMLAKNRYIHYIMTKQFKNNIQRTYYAKVQGILETKQGKIDAPILELPKPSILRKVDPSGLSAITNYEVIKETHNSSILKLTLETGRTHQIRVHMKHIGHPIVGDKLYGIKDDQMYLHSTSLSFKHPILQTDMVIINEPIWYK